MPFRDAGDTIEEALASIQAQTLRNFELLAIDDGSRDDGPRRVACLAQQDDRIRMLKATGRGLVDALNLGLFAARAALVARMDADDRAEPRRLSMQCQHLQMHPADQLVASRTHLFPEERVCGGYRAYVDWQNRCLSPQDIAEEIYVEAPFAHPSVMFRRRPVLRLGGYRAGNFPEDYDLWLRMVHAGHRMAKIPDVLLHWRDHPDRLSRSDARYSRDAFDVLRASYLARDPRLRRRRQLAIWGAGRRSRRRARLLLGQGFRLAAWVDIDIRKIGKVMDGAPVVPVEWLGREPRPFVLCYVNSRGARELIGEKLLDMGYRRGIDYLMVG
jgi:glycosyltransferase involved in cell wall biosynthesis